MKFHERHRIADAIITNHKIFAARTTADAARLIARETIDYVVTCKGLDDPFVSDAEGKAPSAPIWLLVRRPRFWSH